MLMQLSDEVYPLLAPEHKKVEIRADENCKVYGDADKLARIFNNILKNAIAYSNPDSTIVISAWEEPPGTVILFSNQGQTISPEEQQRILTSSIGGMKRDRPTAGERVWDLPSQKNWWICMEEPFV